MLIGQSDRSAFFRRLRLFGTGVFIGCVCVYFILIRGKDFGFWTPGARVLEKIRLSDRVYTKKAECLMDCLHITKAEVESLFDSTGEVNFDRSAVHQQCPVYIISGKKNDLEVTVSTCDSTASIVDVKRSSSTGCGDCKTL